MRHLLWTTVLGAAMIGTTPSPARAQIYGGLASPDEVGSYYGAPGYYGTAWGYPSYGWPRTYTVFSSPYGAGYAYGYYPSYTMAGYFGVRLWRPGFAAPGYLYGAGNYGTFASPSLALKRGYPPPSIGWYAPGFGPPPFIAW